MDAERGRHGLKWSASVNEFCDQEAHENRQAYQGRHGNSGKLYIN